MMTRDLDNALDAVATLAEEWDFFVGNANGRGLIRIEVHGTGEHIASMPRGEISEKRAALISDAPRLAQREVDLMAAITSLKGALEQKTKFGGTKIEECETLKATIKDLLTALRNIAYAKSRIVRESPRDLVKIALDAIALAEVQS